MKVGTDAVILGCFIEMDSTKNILDIGCGSGIISLIAAQKSNAQIRGIDVDEDSVKQAQENFELSPWVTHLRAQHISLQDFSQNNEAKFDLIISNPPFFINSMKSPSDRRNLARHTDSLSSQDLLNAARILLTTHGRLALILPSTEGEELIKLALNDSFFLRRKIYIQPKPSKNANRLVLEFGLSPCDLKEEKLAIREEDYTYSKDYRQLTKDFYLAF